MVDLQHWDHMILMMEFHCPYSLEDKHREARPLILHEDCKPLEEVNIWVREALAMTGIIGETVYIKSVLSQIFGERVSEIPVIIVTDSKNLEEAVYSTKLVDDPWLIPDIAIIKEWGGKLYMAEKRWSAALKEF